MGKRGPYTSTLTLERDKKIIELYCVQGLSSSAIGEIFSVTRQYVCQRLSAHGVNFKNGGQAAHRQERAQQRLKSAQIVAQRKNARRMKTWGLTESMYQLLESQYGGQFTTGSPLYKYRIQRRNVTRHGIVWNLTFPEWWQVWQESGVWDSRGRGDGYRMARIDMNSPFEIGNIRIVSGVEHMSEVMTRLYAGLQEAA